MILTQDYLNQARCDTPGCTEEHGRIFLHARCHENQGTTVSYEGGVLRVECSVCNTVVAEILVAP